MKKMFITMGLATGLAFVLTTGAVVAEDSKDSKEVAVAKKGDKENSKGGRHNEDFCEQHPQACKPKPVSGE
ncbi:MAG: hypothetical protein ACR652_21410 [Methylocystis sp.]|uniref:hypothetical protein n=1 Tax=Methylocystis sp. TaxID=1911079 RepID=UPI003DA33DC7